MVSLKPSSTIFFNSLSYYFGFTSGQWRFYYASGQSARGNPSEALLIPEGEAGST